MKSKVPVFVLLLLMTVFLDSVVAVQTHVDKEKTETDQISEQARAVREQTMRHAGELEKMKNRSEVPIESIQHQDQKSDQERLRLELDRLKKNQLVRVNRLSKEVNELLQKIKDLNKPEVATPVNPKANVGSQKSLSPQPGKSNGSGQAKSSINPETSSGEQEAQPENHELILNKKPVDELALADNLIAVGSYGTAIKLLRKLQKSKDKELSVKQRNWIVYQLGVAYRASGLHDEALRQFRIAANSKVSDISTSMAKWWIGQIANQQQITSATNSIQKQIEQAGK